MESSRPIAPLGTGPALYPPHRQQPTADLETDYDEEQQRQLLQRPEVLPGL